jgi:hypothetical protein
MALLWADGFDGIEDWASEAAAGTYYDAWSHANIAIEAQYGRRLNSKGLFISQGNYISKNINTTNTLIVGMALKPYTADPISSTTASLLQFMELLSSINLYFRVVGGGSGQIEVRTGSITGTVLGTSSSGFTPGAWSFFEAKVIYGVGTGVIEIRLDGAAVMELTGLDIGDGGCNAVKIVGSHYVPGGLNHYIDDFYICDDTGDFNNDFLGDVRVDAYFPTADGTYQDFAKSTGAASWSLLDRTLRTPPTTCAARPSASKASLTTSGITSGNSK